MDVANLISRNEALQKENALLNEKIDILSSRLSALTFDSKVAAKRIEIRNVRSTIADIRRFEFMVVGGYGWRETQCMHAERAVLEAIDADEPHEGVLRVGAVQFPFKSSCYTKHGTNEGWGDTYGAVFFSGIKAVFVVCTKGDPLCTLYSKSVGTAEMPAIYVASNTITVSDA